MPRPRRRPRPRRAASGHERYDPESEDRLRSPVPRLAWRYRSELAPVYAAVALLAAGLGLHGHAERAYASATTTAATLWLAAAAWLGPLTRRLLLAWLAGTLAGGL